MVEYCSTVIKIMFIKYSNNVRNMFNMQLCFQRNQQKVVIQNSQIHYKALQRGIMN